MEDEQLSQAARRRAAQYARQPSLWTAPSPATAVGPDSNRRSAPIVRIVVAVVLLLGGPPWLLWTGFGNPITAWSSWWATSPFTDATASPGAGLRVLLIWAGWLTWAVLATLLVGSVAGVLRGRRLPRWRLPMPLHRLIVGLTGTATVALVATPAGAAVAATSVAQAVPASGSDQAVFPPRPESTAGTPNRAHKSAREAEPMEASGLVTVAVGRDRYEYRVRRGDTLSKIAKSWLDDANRWPGLCSLNKHRHVARGQALTDCDLIYPGWSLRLPADAVPPAGATPAPPTSHGASPRTLRAKRARTDNPARRECRPGAREPRCRGKPLS